MLAEITDALRRGDAAAALASARSFAAAEPANPAAQHLLGVALLQTGDRAGARVAFDAALAVAPDLADVYFSLANLHLAEGDTPAAIRRLQEAVSLDPNQLGAYVMLLHLALARGDVAEATRNLKLAQRVDDEHPQVLVAQGYVLQAGGDADGALKCFTAAATKAPTLAAAQLALGNAYLGRGMWPFAEQALQNALALDPSRAASTLRALVEARRRQGKAAETLQSLAELIALAPDDIGARAMRADILTERNEPEAALDDLLVVLDKRPDHARSLLQATTRLARTGRVEQAVALAEAALAKAPANDELWRVRLNISGLLGEEGKPLLDRWQDAAPDSEAVLDTLAGYHFARGELALAESYADLALAKNPALQGAVGVKLAAEMREAPEAALARVEALLPRVNDPEQRRSLLGWAASALDALGRFDEAGARWKDMIRMPVTGLMPPPGAQPATAAPAGQGTGTLLFSPPGLRAEFVLRNAKQMLGTRLRLDRIAAMNAGDGFGLMRFAAGHPQAGSAQRWRESLESIGLDPQTAIDWLPFVDGYTLQALQGARVVAMLADPRDMLLNWLAHGSLQHYLFSNDARRSAEWLAAALTAVADHRDAHPDTVHVVRFDGGDAGQAAAELERLLELPQPLPGLFGPAPRFVDGHWRRYRDAFAEEFAILAPVAQRFGYPTV